MFYTYYFLASTGMIGFFTAFLIATPLYQFSSLMRGKNSSLAMKIKALTDIQFSKSVYFLMKIQPWYNAKVDIQLPENEKYFIVANHRSHLDVFIFLTKVPGIRVVAKKSLFSFPFLGPMMKVFRHIPLEKGNFSSYFDALKKVHDGVIKDEPILIFPEMTRCSEGLLGLQKFQTYPFHFALQENIKILPVVVYGTDQAWPKGRFGISFRKKIVLKSLPLIDSKSFKSAFDLKERVFLDLKQGFLKIHGKVTSKEYS